MIYVGWLGAHSSKSYTWRPVSNVNHPFVVSKYYGWFDDLTERTTLLQKYVSKSRYKEQSSTNICVQMNKWIINKQLLNKTYYQSNKDKYNTIEIK